MALLVLAVLGVAVAIYLTRVLLNVIIVAVNSGPGALQSNSALEHILLLDELGRLLGDRPLLWVAPLLSAIALLVLAALAPRIDAIMKERDRANTALDQARNEAEADERRAP